MTCPFAVSEKYAAFLGLSGISLISMLCCYGMGAVFGQFAGVVGLFLPSAFVVWVLQ